MISRLMISCGVMAITMAAAPAFAEDGKALPGGACQAQFSSIPGILSRTGSILLNAGSGAITVFCPVVKDIEAGRIKRAEVRVVDRSPSGSIGCTLASHKSDGTVHQSQSLNSSGSSNTVQTLTFAGQTAAGGGSYVLRCDLPGSAGSLGPSSIVMYNIVEE